MEQELERMYVTGDMTLKTLSEQTGISEDRLRKLSRKGHWLRARMAWREGHRADPVPDLRMAVAGLASLLVRTITEDTEQFMSEEGLNTRALKEVTAVLKEVTAMAVQLSEDAAEGARSGVIQIAEPRG